MMDQLINNNETLQKKRRRRVKRVRNKELKIRFSEQEYETIKTKAGEKSIAEFMREYCLNAADYQLPKAVKYPKIDPKVMLILAGAANNLNQIARGINQQNLRQQPLDLLSIYGKIALLEQILSDIEKRLTSSTSIDNEDQ